MTWAVTPDVERFDEASDWFQKRTVITAPTAAEMTGRIAQDSFWVGAGLQLTQVQRVFDKMAVAIEKGETFADWRAKVRGELRNDAHAETVFRNATQRAYNAGRWYQMLEPDVVRFRPYWMFDAILDGRTTLICQVCGDTILPADNPWWATHVPPLHHKCRSSIRNLRKAEAERRGISPNAPHTADIRAPGAWGEPPTKPGWKPDLKKVDPALAKEVKRKEKVRAEKPVPAPKPKAPKAVPVAKPEHSYEHWVEHYTPKYGVAAKSVGWGRMAQEVGLDMPISEVGKLIERFRGTPVGAAYQDMFASVSRKMKPKETLRTKYAELSAPAKAIAAIAGHVSRVEARGQALRMTGLVAGSEAEKQLLAGSLRMFDLLYGKTIQHPTDFSITFDPRRSYAVTEDKEIRVRPEAKAIAHEWAHPVELQNGDLARRGAAFRDRRSNGKMVSLRESTGDERYRHDEFVLDDEFIKPYIGKVYSHGRKDEATEVTSTSIEQWTAGRIETAAAMHKDPDHMYFGLGQMSGHDLQASD